jgi:hypothetical protein
MMFYLLAEVFPGCFLAGMIVNRKSLAAIGENPMGSAMRLKNLE